MCFHAHRDTRLPPHVSWFIQNSCREINLVNCELFALALKIRHLRWGVIYCGRYLCGESFIPVGWWLLHLTGTLLAPTSSYCGHLFGNHSKRLSVCVICVRKVVPPGIFISFRRTQAYVATSRCRRCSPRSWWDSKSSRRDNSVRVSSSFVLPVLATQRAGWF